MVKVDFSVAETHLASVAAGQRLTATSIAYPGVEFEGVISNVDTRLDPVIRAINVRAVIKNKDNRLRPGMLLTVTVEKRVLNTLVLPEKALVPVQDKQFVYVVKDDVAHQTEVVIGERRPGIVQIINGVSEGDEVITTPYSFFATAGVIARLGAKPVFVDSENDTWNMCPNFLETAIKDRIKNKKKPKAIIVVNSYGMPAKWDEIMKVARKYEIAVIRYLICMSPPSLSSWEHSRLYLPNM